MISLGYLVLHKNKKHKDKLIKLRDTRGTISFALRISFPNEDYKPKSRKSHGRAQKQAKSFIEPRSNDISFTMSPSPTPADIKNKEENKLRVRKWKADHPDKYQKHLEWVRQWRKKNRKKLLEYNQNYRDTHREAYRAQQRDYARRKREKIRQ